MNFKRLPKKIITKDRVFKLVHSKFNFAPTRFIENFYYTEDVSKNCIRKHHEQYLIAKINNYGYGYTYLSTIGTESHNGKQELLDILNDTIFFSFNNRVYPLETVKYEFD